MDEDKKEARRGVLSHEKYWSEIGVEEKIERMRGVVKRIESQLQNAYRLINELLKHSHNPHTGEVTSKLDKSPGDLPFFRQPPQSTDEVYF